MGSIQLHQCRNLLYITAFFNGFPQRNSPLPGILIAQTFMFVYFMYICALNINRVKLFSPFWERHLACWEGLSYANQHSTIISSSMALSKVGHEARPVLGNKDLNNFCIPINKILFSFKQSEVWDKSKTQWYLRFKMLILFEEKPKLRHQDVKAEWKEMILF